MVHNAEYVLASSERAANPQIHESSIFWRDHNIKRTTDNSHLAMELWCDAEARPHDFIV